METVTIKANMNGDFRRFTVNKNTVTFTPLYQVLCNLYKQQSLIVKYLDDEGDKITINTDEELTELIRLTNASKSNVMRLFVFEGQNTQTVNTPLFSPTNVTSHPFLVLSDLGNSNILLPEQVQSFPSTLVAVEKIPSNQLPRNKDQDTGISSSISALSSTTASQMRQLSSDTAKQTVDISREMVSGVSDLSKQTANINISLAQQIASVSSVLSQQTASKSSELSRETVINSLSLANQAKTIGAEDREATTKRSSELSRDTADKTSQISKETAQQVDELSKSIAKMILNLK